MQTYITPIEAHELYPQDDQYNEAQRLLALELSFGDVNSAIADGVRVPVVSEWNGKDSIKAPAKLKSLQGDLYRIQLQKMNAGGWTEELRESYELIMHDGELIRQGELIIAEQTTEKEVGWHIDDQTASNGTAFVKGDVPPIEHRFRVVITSEGTSYVADGVTFDLFRADSSASIATGTADYEWQSVGLFFVRFMGQFTLGDEIHVRGVPSESVDVPNERTGIYQQRISC